MKISRLSIAGAALLAATLYGAVAGAETGSPEAVQVSCSAYSKVNSANEVYVISLDGPRRKARVSRNGEAAREVSAVSNERAVVIFMEADGGRYSLFLNRGDHSFSGSFLKDGALLKEQLHGTCAVPAGKTL